MIFYVFSNEYNNKTALRVGWKICFWYPVRAEYDYIILYHVYWSYFGAESFVFQVAIQKFKDQDI